MGDRERFNLALSGLAQANWQSDRPLIEENGLSGVQAFLLAIDMTILPRFLQVRTPLGKPVLTAHAGNRRLLEFVDPGLAHVLKDFNGMIHEGPDALDVATSGALYAELEDWLGNGEELTLATHRGITDDHAGGIGLRADKLGQLWDIALYGEKRGGISDPVSHMLKHEIMTRHAWLRYNGTELTQTASPADDRLEQVDTAAIAATVEELLSSAAPDQAAEFLVLGPSGSTERIILCGAGPDRLFACLPEAEALELLAYWDQEVAPGL